LAGGNVLIVAARDDAEKRRHLADLGAEVSVLPNAAGKVDLAALMKALGERSLNEVHIEAGYKLNGSLLREGLVDELLLYMAPSILGDSSRGMFNLPEFAALSERYDFNVRSLTQIGRDIRIRAHVVREQGLGARD
jgi:diaminohydroxyphosphoribosylaminopyrimidine deaminase/5-amino-6-(5-phosphoribosylamino)uracil reductase